MVCSFQNNVLLGLFCNFIFIFLHICSWYLASKRRPRFRFVMFLARANEIDLESDTVKVFLFFSENDYELQNS